MLLKRSVKVRVPASTSNLGPGFDTVGMALRIYNTIFVEPSSSGLTITASGEGSDELCSAESSMVLKAMRAAFDQWDQSFKDHEQIHIHIENEVPISRGLGGSSTAIIGGVLLAAALCGKSPTQREILEIALPLEKGHPDNITPALVGGLTVSKVEGKRVHFIKIPTPPKLHCVVSIPRLRLSTQEARKLLPQKVPLKDAVFNLQSLAFLLASLFTNSPEDLSIAMQDRLHQPYRTALFPQMQDIFSSAMEAGADGVALSGSGSSVIAFVSEAGRLKTVSSMMQKTLEEKGISGKTVVTDIDQEGARVLTFSP
ncbi:MAG TPA: homoserine kinase [Spirochaetota bacterium]|nr:homoserine kinase [Spirochaetota bacterium]